MNKLWRKSLVLFCISFLFYLTSCVSLNRRQYSAEEEETLFPAAAYIPEAFLWEEIYPGVSCFDFENPDFPLIYHAVRISLSSGDSELLPRLKLVTSQWEETSVFAKRDSCLLAMNATPFSKTALTGLYKVNDSVVSAPVARYAALGVQCEADAGIIRAQIFDTQINEELKDFNFAFGGFFVVLKDGVVCREFIRRLDSRSGVGLSEDGKTIYLLVVEGEYPRKSRGLSYPQCGEIFRAMGCRDAMEFDGGGSSDLCINGRSVMSYRVNRKQGNSFGVKVK